MIKHILVGVALIIIAGCSSMERLVDSPVKSSSTRVEPYDIDTYKRSVHLFDPVSLGSVVDAQLLQPRLDNLLILVDDRDDKALYRGIPKNIYVYEIFRRFNLTVPRLNLRGGAFRLAERSGDLFVGSYQPRQLQHNLDMSEELPSLGTTSLQEGIDRLTEIAVTLQGRTGLLIITDWSNIGRAELEAVERFRQRGRALAGFKVLPDVASWEGSDHPYCVFAVGVGNGLSRSQFDKVDACGFSAAADKIAQPRDMAYFVQKVLYTTPKDSDLDGIYDYKDKCPGTPKGRVIDGNGCLRFPNEVQQ